MKTSKKICLYALTTSVLAVLSTIVAFAEDKNIDGGKLTFAKREGRKIALVEHAGAAGAFRGKPDNGGKGAISALNFRVFRGNAVFFKILFQKKSAVIVREDADIARAYTKL